MGRKKLNRTREELLERQRARSKRFYERNKQRLSEERMARYRPCYVGITVGKIHSRCARHLNGRESYLFQRKLRKNKTRFRCYVVDIIREKSPGEAVFQRLLSMETRYISEFNTRSPIGYNLTLGGTGMVGLMFTSEHRRKISEALTGKKCSDKTKDRLRKLRLGTTHSAETKQKMSLKGRGRICSTEKKVKLSMVLTGRKFSDQSRKKMSDSHLQQIPWNRGKVPSKHTRELWSIQRRGRKHSEETKQKMSVAHSGENHHFYGKSHSLESRLKISRNKPLGASGIRGVTFRKKSNKYVAQQRYNGTTKYLGSYNSQKEAGQAVEAFRKENNLYGI